MSLATATGLDRDTCYIYDIQFMEAVIKNSIHQVRTKSGMTQEALAEKVAVTRQTIIAMEKGNYTPSVLLALKLAEVFGVKVEELFTISHE